MFVNLFYLLCINKCCCDRLNTDNKSNVFLWRDKNKLSSFVRSRKQTWSHTTCERASWWKVCQREILQPAHTRTTKSEIQTHPERKNVAASVFFLKRERFTDGAWRPRLICCSGRMWSALGGRLCWWVDWCWCWGFVGWWSLFLWSRGRKRLVLCRKAVPAGGIIRAGALERLEVSLVRFSEDAAAATRRPRQRW